MLFPTNAFSQNSSSRVQFHGTNILTGQYSTRQGTNSLMPQNYLRNELQMTLALYDVPFGTSFFVSSEDHDMSQKINNLSFYVDLNALKNNKSRIESENKKNNLENTKAPAYLRFLSKFSKIEGGRFRPNYGDLTLSRIPVSGLNLEFGDKILYAAFASGQTKKYVNSSDILRQSFNQNLIFGKLGIGPKMKSHLYFTYMDITDEVPSDSKSLETSVATGKPGSNKIFGTEFRLSFFKHHWIIDGEAGFSTLTRDIRIEQEPDSIFNGFPDFLIKIVEPNISSSGDYAYGFGTKINLRTTRISGIYRWVGPGYYTLGNPNLINDRETMEGKVDQLFFKRKLSLSGFYKTYSDNLKKTKDRYTNSESYGVTAKLLLRKFPFLQVSYVPNYQKSTINNFNITNAVNIFNISTGYNYALKKKLRAYTGLNYSAQQSDYRNDTIQYHSHNQSLTLTQALNIKPFQVNFNLGYRTIAHTVYDLNILFFDLSGSHTLKENWKNTLGMRLMNSKREDVNTIPVLTENKLSFYWQSQIKLWKNGSFSLNIKDNIYKSSENDFNELVVLSTLTIIW